VALGGPVLYGEGAVVNAARDLGGAYRNAGGEVFVAANYPPVYLWLAGLGAGDAFLAGRFRIRPAVEEERDVGVFLGFGDVQL